MWYKKYLFSVIILICTPIAGYSQWQVGPHIVISIPENEFANVGETGGGFGIKAVRQTSLLSDALGIRGDFAFLTFGDETTFILDPLSGGFIPLDVRNEGFRLTFGPQLSFGGRSFKVYVGANGGFYFFRKNISTQFTTFAGTQFFQDFEDNNFALGWNVGGGIQYDIGLGPLLDLSFEFQTMHNLPETVEREENLDASIPDITAHEFTIKAGVTFFLGR